MTSTIPRRARAGFFAVAITLLAACSSEPARDSAPAAGNGAEAGGAGASAGLGGASGASAGAALSAGAAGTNLGGGGAGSGGVSAGGAPSSGGSASAGAPSGGSDQSGGVSGAGTSGAGQGGAAGSGPTAGQSGSGAGGLAGSNAGGAGSGGVGGSSGLGGGGSAGADPKFLIFLLLGQSNMEGAPQPQSQDLAQNPRIRVLAYDNCQNVSREYNQWYPASPPLHSCGAGVGPGDYFSKTLIESLPSDYTIGLVPCAVNGAPIDLFRKDVARNGYTLPPDNHWETGYEWIVSRAREAQKVGVIRGILFHQGESDNGQTVWVSKVKGLVSDLRTDLALGDVPFLAGELYYDGCCAGHNTLVQQLASEVTNGFVVSASGLNGTDQYHFDLPGQRELGTRYGNTLQQALALP